MVESLKTSMYQDEALATRRLHLLICRSNIFSFMHSLACRDRHNICAFLLLLVPGL